MDSTEDFLKKFDYSYTRTNNNLIIKMDFSQIMIIDFSDPQKTVIKDKLVGWNFLTGVIEMSLKNAILYNFIAAIIISFLYIYFHLEYDGMFLIFFYLLFLFWVLLWANFYLVKLENLKQNLIKRIL